MTAGSGSPAQPDLRLAAFIRANVDMLIVEWVAFARTCSPASEKMTRLALQDHIVEMLSFIADDLGSPQTMNEQSEKSKGRAPEASPLTQSAAQIHASLRLVDGFDIEEMVSEYRALRASVVKQWMAHKETLASRDLADLIRFNEGIDQCVAESVAQYTKTITRSRDLFLGILGHDLRNPISAACMGAKWLLRGAVPDDPQAVIATHIVNATERGIEILDKLLDMTRTAFGEEFRIDRHSVDIGLLGQNIVEEMRPIANGHAIIIKVTGQTAGDFDGVRIGQVFSNLIGNAIRYSAPDSDIDVRITGEAENIRISVHNTGDPIPVQKRKTIFQSMTRGVSHDETHSGSTSLGLGLFIVQKIVAAHGGELLVTSSAEEGTIFTAILPRH